jgi:hypothetical protein
VHDVESSSISPDDGRSRLSCRLSNTRFQPPSQRVSAHRFSASRGASLRLQLPGGYRISLHEHDHKTCFESRVRRSNPSRPGKESQRPLGRAYDPVYPMCLTLPGLVLKAGESHHGVLSFMAAEPGHHWFPILNVDSIDGIYRLRWDFREGVDALAKGGRTVTSVSNEFRMVLRGAPVARVGGQGDAP